MAESAPCGGPAPLGGSVTLRRMRWWDVERVLPLERELFPREPWSAELFWSELAGVPALRHYLVAADPAGELLGYAGLMTSGSAADVQTLAVRRQAQGRGVGAALLQALTAQAQQRGCAAVLLEVRTDNPGAQRFYERHGFERLSLRRGYYEGGRVDAVVMRRRLRPPVAAAP